MNTTFALNRGTAIKRVVVLMAVVVAATFLVATVVGCAGGPLQLMPTPNVYAFGERDPFPDVPPEFQNNRVDVLYLTDRALDSGDAQNPVYGYKRSRSVAFGVAQVEFGKDVSWEELVKASRSAQRSVDLAMTIAKTTELIRFPPTPRAVVELPENAAANAATQAATQPHTTRQPSSSPTTAPTAAMALREEIGEDVRLAMSELSRRLAQTPEKDVYIFVHGYNNTFQDSVTTIAELWHFLGRRGVPVAYSWPAGSAGLLRGYTYDRESGEFTVYHLKQMLRVIAACPDVRKVHLIAHSRGTDVLLTALRELHLEIGGGGRGGPLLTREQLKIGTLILAAPDLDLDVVIQRMVTARIGRIPEHMTMYVCSKDEALGLSNWLFGGMMRLGKIRADTFTPAELETLRKAKTVQIVDAQISNAGNFGHDYFHSSPAVSSDLILVMRYGLLPGAENGRPLGGSDKGFWTIDDQYPRTGPVEARTASGGK
jgi:esterase/lipase superfamily enzyme